VSRLGNAYRRIRALFAGRPSRFSWIDDRVAGSGRPMTRNQVKWLREHGVDAIISLTEDPLPREWISEAGLEYRHMPLEDHATPDPDVLKQIVDELLDLIDSGKRVLVHCAAGLGRTGVVLAAYLVAAKGVSGEEAIKIVRDLRPGSIEPNQEWSVIEFQRRYFPRAGAAP